MELTLSSFAEPNGDPVDLFARLIDRATRAGMTRMGLHVSQANTRAQALYARAGFVPTGGPPMLNDRGVWEIEMRRMLRPPLRQRLRALRSHAVRA